MSRLLQPLNRMMRISVTQLKWWFVEIIQIALMTRIIDFKISRFIFGCSTFTLCNLNLPFARDIKSTKIMFFCCFFFLFSSLRRQRWKSSSIMHIGEILTLQITLNEVPSWQMNGVLAEWHGDMNQRHKKHWQQWQFIMFTKPNRCLAHTHFPIYFEILYIW